MSDGKKSTLSDVETLIAATEAVGVTGNIVPLAWVEHIQFEKGKPDFLGMMLLAEIVYWHRPEVLMRDEKTGAILKWKKRFKGNKLHRSRETLAKKFRVSTRQIGSALKRLEAAGLIQRETCHQSNRLYITLVVSRLADITPSLTPKKANTDDIIYSPIEKKSFVATGNPPSIHENVSSTDPLPLNEPPKVIHCPSYKEKEIKRENRTDSNKAAAVVPKSVWLAAESFIGETLTTNQQQATQAMLSSLTLENDTRRRLQDEVEAGLTDSRCFSKTGRDFHRKLKAMTTSIQNSTWTRPLCLDEKCYTTKTQTAHQQQKDTHTLMLSWNTLWNELGSVHQWFANSTSEQQREDFRLLQKKHLSTLQAIEVQVLAQNHTINFDAIKQKNKERLYVQ